MESDVFSPRREIRGTRRLMSECNLQPMNASCDGICRGNWWYLSLLAPSRRAGRMSLCQRPTHAASRLTARPLHNVALIRKALCCDR